MITTNSHDKNYLVALIEFSAEEYESMANMLMAGGEIVISTDPSTDVSEAIDLPSISILSPL